MSNVPTTPVRLKDIARELNVSVMTVSKVVRGCADVGAETRTRVLARIKELNYQPNWVARSLAARRTFMIGLIVPDLMHSFFAEIAKGVSATIRPLASMHGPPAGEHAGCPWRGTRRAESPNIAGQICIANLPPSP